MILLTFRSLRVLMALSTVDLILQKETAYYGMPRYLNIVTLQEIMGLTEGKNTTNKTLLAFLCL
jgi:hypothetical protein